MTGGRHNGPASRRADRLYRRLDHHRPMLFAKLGLSAIADEAREKRTRVVEDPILRHDFEGLRKLRHAVNWTRAHAVGEMP